MKCESVYWGTQAHVYKTLLDRLNSDKFDTNSPVIFVSIITSIIFSSPGKIPKNRSIVQPALLSVKNLHGCSEWRLHFAISIPKDKYDVREKRRVTKLFFQSLNNNYYFLCWFTSCLWNIYFGKNTAIICWPPCSRILSISSKCVLRDVIAQEWIPRIIRKPIDCACS